MSDGHFVCYQRKNFGEEALKLLQVANAIIEEYEGSGMSMTLRQLYYQMVARDHLPNSTQSYARMGALISDGRMAGLVSWTAIEDRTRNLKGHQTFKTPEGAVSWLAKEHYRIDMWEDQPFRPEVWVEKEALQGVIGSICSELRVDYFACKGYNSQSEQWRAGRRLAKYASKGQRPIVFHLGDHDPSGIDMTRDNQERLSLFAGSEVQVVRLALNMSQIEELRPPPNPAKMTDSRFADYHARYGDESWELDALSPSVLRDLISSSVLRIRDEVIWKKAEALEEQDRGTIQDMINEEERGP